MSTQSFADLGVSRAVRRASLRASRASPSRSRSSALVIGDVLAGRDVLAKSPTGSGKTLAFGIPLVERIEADDPRPAALVLAPTRELATQIVDEHPRRSLTPARCASPPSTAASASSSRPRTPPARTCSSPRPGRLEDLLAARRIHLDERPDARPRRGRPDARHGLPPAGRPDRRAVPARRARRCSSRPRSTARPAGWPAAYTRDPVVHEHGPTSAGARRRDRAPLRRRSSTSTASRRSSSELRARPRADARVRAHQARRRPARQAARRARRRGRRDARQQVPAPARAGTRAVRVRRTSTRSSRPTSRRAASTSSGSPT